MEAKMWMSSFIFVFMTVLKLLFPEQTAQLRQQTVMLIDMDMDYRTLVKEVGTYLTNDTAYEVAEVLQITNREEQIIIHTPSPSAVVAPHDSVSDDFIRKREAFLRSQEAYSSYEVPTNVFYDVTALPFSHSAPVSGTCSSGFGYRVHPIDQQVLFHYGTDYDVEEGTEILAFADGIVSGVGQEAGYGKYVCIDHDDGWKTLYAHCSSVSVVSGQRISEGESIGKSGQTGRVTGPHLHFELIHNGYYTNPEFYL